MLKRGIATRGLVGFCLMVLFSFTVSAVDLVLNAEGTFRPLEAIGQTCYVGGASGDTLVGTRDILNPSWSSSSTCNAYKISESGGKIGLWKGVGIMPNTSFTVSSPAIVHAGDALDVDVSWADLKGSFYTYSSSRATQLEGGKSTTYCWKALTTSMGSTVLPVDEVLGTTAVFISGDGVNWVSCGESDLRTKLGTSLCYDGGFVSRRFQCTTGFDSSQLYVRVVYRKGVGNPYLSMWDYVRVSSSTAVHVDTPQEICGGDGGRILEVGDSLIFWDGNHNTISFKASSIQTDSVSLTVWPSSIQCYTYKYQAETKMVYKMGYTTFQLLSTKYLGRDSATGKALICMKDYGDYLRPPTPDPCVTGFSGDQYCNCYYGSVNYVCYGGVCTDRTIVTTTSLPDKCGSEGACSGDYQCIRMDDGHLDWLRTDKCIHLVTSLLTTSTVLPTTTIPATTIPSTTTLATTLTPTTTTICSNECDWFGCKGDYNCETQTDGCKDKIWSQECAGYATTVSTTVTSTVYTTTFPSTTTLARATTTAPATTTTPQFVAYPSQSITQRIWGGIKTFTCRRLRLLC